MKKIIVMLFIMYITLDSYAGYFLNERKGDWQEPGITISTVDVVKTINILDYPDANNNGLSTANNELAVQAAINDRELGGITIIEFPPGEYYFNAPVNINNSNIVLSGSGSNETIFRFTFWGTINGNCINITGLPGSSLNQNGSPFNEDAEPIYNVGIEKMKNLYRKKQFSSFSR
ncbi:MAG: hypothetical protein K9N07_00550 [Candidatus Cloacimonetes bacterium]|nr:hypothetical protein [Candidatus Cloacimonadota bacterium]